MNENARRSGFVAVVACLMIGLSVAASASDGEDLPGSRGPSERDPSVTVEEARDLQTLADEHGMTFEQAVDEFGWQERFSEMVEQLREAYPAEFAGARITRDPASPAWVAFRGAVPDAAAGTIDSFEEPVTTHGHRGFSEQELDRRLQIVHHRVWARRDLVASATSGYDVETGQVTIEVEGRGTPDAQARKRLEDRLLELLPAEARAWPLSVDVIESVRHGDDTVYGGVAITGCTSGFSVVKDGVRGISTAAHCSNDQRYDGRLNLTFKNAHGGEWGDVQWHTSTEHEADDFYAAANDRRDVSERRMATEGQSLCRYGKTTGKECDEVYQLNHCRGDYCHLTAMHNREADGGDSGGPWYWGNTAYGIHSGYKWWNFKYRDVFTPATHVDNALGAFVAVS